MQNETYLIAKGFYNISNTAKYFDAIIKSKETLPPTKHIIGNYKKKLDWIINDITTTMTARVSHLFRKEMETFETLSFENVFDEMIAMTEDERLEIEAYCKEVKKRREHGKAKSE
jgi:hypothetical protein